MTICGRTESDAGRCRRPKSRAPPVEGADVGYVVADVTSEDDVVEAVAATVERGGGLDIAFACAGGSRHLGPLVAADLDAVRATIELNYVGTFLTIKHAARPMLAQGSGSIIGMSSHAGADSFRSLGCLRLGQGRPGHAVPGGSGRAGSPGHSGQFRSAGHRRHRADGSRSPTGAASWTTTSRRSHWVGWASPKRSPSWCDSWPETSPRGSRVSASGSTAARTSVAGPTTASWPPSYFGGDPLDDLTESSGTSTTSGPSTTNGRSTRSSTCSPPRCGSAQRWPASRPRSLRSGRNATGSWSTPGPRPSSWPTTSWTCPRGSEFITSAVTFSTTVAPGIRNGLVPVVVDVDLDTYQIDVEAIEGAPSAIGPAPSSCRTWPATARTGIGSARSQTPTTSSWWRTRPTPSEPTLDGTPTGLRSDISVTSFAMSHIITAAGNGGMVMTDRDDWWDRALLRRRWGRSSEPRFFGSRQG